MLPSILNQAQRKNVTLVRGICGSLLAEMGAGTSVRVSARSTRGQVPDRSFVTFSSTRDGQHGGSGVTRPVARFPINSNPNHCCPDRSQSDAPGRLLRAESPNLRLQSAISAHPKLPSGWRIGCFRCTCRKSRRWCPIQPSSGHCSRRSSAIQSAVPDSSGSGCHQGIQTFRLHLAELPRVTPQVIQQSLEQGAVQRNRAAGSSVRL